LEREYMDEFNRAAKIVHAEMIGIEYVEGEGLISEAE